MAGDESQIEATATTASLACPDESQKEATATKVSLTCPADNCSKKLKSKQTLGKHMDKFHSGVQIVSNHVRNFLLSPIPGPSNRP